MSCQSQGMPSYYTMNIKVKGIFYSTVTLGLAGTTILLASNVFLDAKQPEFRSFEFTYEVSISEIPCDAKMVEVYIPLPSSDDQQTITSYTISANLAYTEFVDPTYGNSILVFKSFKKEPERVNIILNLVVRRRVVTLSEFKSRFESENPGALERYLEPDRLVPIDGPVLTEAHEIFDENLGDLENMRLFYDHLFTTMSYDKSGTGWGNGDALYACDVRSGNCTDIHSLFIGMARASGIPARFVMGFPLAEEMSEGRIPGYHCWAEFYLQDEGWIPVDISEAIRHPQRRDYYFGNLDANRIAFTIGRDIVVGDSTSTDTLNYFIYPFVRTDAEEEPQVEYKFSFRELDSLATEPLIIPATPQSRGLCSLPLNPAVTQDVSDKWSE